jgi:hypothetical protein
MASPDADRNTRGVNRTSDRASVALFAFSAFRSKDPARLKNAMALRLFETGEAQPTRRAGCQNGRRTAGNASSGEAPVAAAHVTAVQDDDTHADGLI